MQILTKTPTEGNPAGNTKPKSNLLAAIAASRRYPIFPCNPANKRPLTEHGFKDATQNELQIMQWWGTMPDSLVGVPTGAASGLDVVDDDTRKKPDAASSAWIERNCAHLAGTRQQKTSGGGTHFIFRHNPETDIGSRVGITVEGAELASIDTRSNGGYIIDWGAHGLASLGEVQAMPPELAAQLHRSRTPRKSFQLAPGGTGLHPSELAELPAALAYLDPSSYDHCLKVIMAMHHAGGQEAFDLGHSFCAGEFTADKNPPHNYGGHDWYQWKWSSLGRGSDREPLKLGTIFKLAREAGYRPDPIVTAATIPAVPGAMPVALDVNLCALLPTVCAEFLAAPEMIFLHNEYLPATVAAERMFKLLAEGREFFRRGNAVVELDADGLLTVVTPVMFRSRLNKGGRKVRSFKVDQNGNFFHSDKHCGEDAAKVLLNASEVNQLPNIKLVTRMPLLVEHEGRLVLTMPGYNDFCGVFVTGGMHVPDVPLIEASTALANLLRDFQFAEGGDRTRGLASLVSPALRMARLVPGNALITALEADDSQAGKGYYLDIRRAIYSETAYMVVQKKGGVGSFDESFNQALFSGAPFVSFDNLRGVMDSPAIEAAITSGDKLFQARVPHKGEVPIDISRTSHELTSNGVSSTRDFSNRLLLSRLRKHSPGYRYPKFREGDLLAHIKANAAYYLGCVHAVVRRWYEAGKPELETDHSFRQWVGALDWIVQNVWNTGPLLDGHQAALGRISDPGLSWLRQLAIVVIRIGQSDLALPVEVIREICRDHDLMPPGAKLDANDGTVNMAIGRVLRRCFTEGDTRVLDGIRIDRSQITDVSRNKAYAHAFKPV